MLIAPSRRQESALMTVCSTVRHGRPKYSDLVIISVPMTFLTSRANTLVSIYDVRQDTDGKLFSYGDPYEPKFRPTTSTTRTSCPRSGLALLPHSRDTQSLEDEGAVLDLFELSLCGAVSYQGLYYTDPSQPSKESRPENTPPMSLIWTRTM